jgi:hypothetical protein
MTALFALACVVPAAVTLDDERRRQIVRVFRDAITLSKQTMRMASQEAEIDQAQFQRQIEMEQGSLKRLAMQPDTFWQWLAVTIAAEFGVPMEVEHGARLAHARAAVDLERAS